MGREIKVNFVVKGLSRYCENGVKDGLNNDRARIVISRHPLKDMFGAFGPKSDLERVPRSHHKGTVIFQGHF